MAEDIEEFPDNTSTVPVDEVAETPVEAQAEAAAPEPEPEVETEEVSRIAKLRQAYADTKRQAALLRQENEVLRGQRKEQPNEEIERRARELAAHEVRQREFNNTCNTIYKDGIKTYGKAQFDDSVQILNQSLGGSVPDAFIEAMAETGDAHKLWHYLAENTDVLEDVAGLPPHRMGAALAKLHSKMVAPKAISKAPAPVKPVGGQTSGEVDLDKMSTAEYMKYMDAHEMRRRFG